MKNALLNIHAHSSKKEAALRKSIEKKTRLLEDLMAKAEMLKMELEFIQHEYNVRIGTLLLKDNQLDLEILQLQNLKELLKGGMTYQQALKYEEDAFYSDMLRVQKEQEKLDEEKKMLEEIADVSEEVLEDIKAIWKKLIKRFHPDLVTDGQEKSRRENLMKQINKAYTERNRELLLAFESQQELTVIAELTLEQLEEALVKLENAIADAEGNLRVLQKSTWYEWKKKMDKGVGDEGKKQDVFAELEQKFLDDIVKKIELVQKLRAEVQPTEAV